ncbi:hypothetical protein ACWEOH_06115 [Agromyces sp. NPDC004153]
MSEPDQLDRERLVEITSSLIDTLTSPEFIERLRKVTEDETRSYDAVADTLSIESLRAAGADLPEGFRLSSRTFEDHVHGTRFELGETGLPGAEAQIAGSICGGAGRFDLCACGGVHW